MNQHLDSWASNFFNEVVEKNLHQFFPFDTVTHPMSDAVPGKQQKAFVNAIQGQIEESVESLSEKKTLAYSYLTRCISPETIRAYGH